MKTRTLIILAAMAVIIAGLAVKTSRKPESKPSVTGKLLLADFPVNDVAKIRVVSPVGTVLVERINGFWVVPTMFQYPARFEKVKETLMTLTEVKIREELRLNDEQKKSIRILPPGAGIPEQCGSSAELFTADGKTIATLLIGDTYMRGGGNDNPAFGGGYPDGQYVSTDNGKTIYLTSRPMEELTADQKFWINPEIVSAESPAVTNLTFLLQGEKPLHIHRDEQNNLVTPVAEDEELDPMAINGIQYILSYFRFDDLADPALTEEQTGMKEASVIHVATKYGEVYTIKIGAKAPGKEQRYVRCEVTLNQPPEAADTESSDKKSPEIDKQKQEERDRIRTKVQDFQERLAKWTYLVDEAKLGSMLVTREKLVKKKGEQKAETDDSKSDSND